MKRLRFILATGLLAVVVPVIGATGSSAAREVQSCSSEFVEVLASGWFGAAGTGAMTFDIINRGATFRISGYPTVSFENASAIAVDHRDVHESSMLFAEPRATVVTLARGGVATFGVSWSDNPVNNEPYNTTCPETARAVIGLLHGVGSLFGDVPINPRPCFGDLLVTPIEPGSWPRQA